MSLTEGGISSRHEIKARLSLSFVADGDVRIVRRQIAGVA